MRRADRSPARNRARKLAWAGSLCFGSGNQFVLDIGFHGHEAVVHGVDSRLIDAGQCSAHQVLGEGSEVSQRRRSLFGEVKTVGAPIGCVVAALDEPGGGQFVDEPSKRDRGEVERFGELVLFCAHAPLQTRENRPLRAGRAEFAGALVGIRPEQARDVMECETQLASRRDGPFVGKR